MDPGAPALEEFATVRETNSAKPKCFFSEGRVRKNVLFHAYISQVNALGPQFAPDNYSRHIIMVGLKSLCGTLGETILLYFVCLGCGNGSKISVAAA